MRDFRSDDTLDTVAEVTAHELGHAVGIGYLEAPLEGFDSDTPAATAGLQKTGIG